MRDKSENQEQAGVRSAHEFRQEWKDGLYQAILRRRDMREFLADPLPDDKLARILAAAHHAGSVGFSQPWSFIVIRDRELRQKVRAHVEEERLRAADGFEGERREAYLSYKLEGILDSPVNVCVTCDRTRFGNSILGRNTMRDTDIYSTCCAIQNLWLAARAEGVGVGWVSILRPDHLRELIGIPGHVDVVAYLCVGYVSDFPERPTLETKGWLPKLPLHELVWGERWGALPGESLLSELRQGEPLALRASYDDESSP